MASTYSPLKIELIGTGEQVAVWGQTTNTNLGTTIEQAIGGKADVTMSSTSITLSLTNTNALQDARALYLNLTGTPGGAATLNLPAVQKAYIVRNGTTGGFAVTVKVTGQTGVSVPNGSTMHLYNNGTDVVNAMTNLPAGATIGGVAIGTGGGSVTSVSGTGTVNGITLTGTVTSSGSLTLGGALTNVDLSTQVTNTLPTSRGGTGQTVTQYCSLTTNVAGTLPVANGGTGNTTLTSNAALIGNGTGAVLGLSPGASGNVMTSNGTTWTSVAAVNSFSAGTTGFTPNTSTTGAVTLAGTLNVANGGTGASTLTANAALIGNGTGAVLGLAPGTSGNVMTSNGTTWTSAATVNSFSGGTTGLTPATATTGAITLSGTLAVANGGTGVTSSTGSGSVVLSASPTFTGTVTTAAIAMADNSLTRPLFVDYAVEGSAIGNTGSTRTLDLTTANFFSATLDQACTFTFSNPPASGKFGCFVLELTNGAAFNITWPASVDWPGGSAPSLTASGKDQLVFTTRDAGTTWFGFLAGKDIK
jgi:hypothetical protein